MVMENLNPATSCLSFMQSLYSNMILKLNLIVKFQIYLVYLTFQRAEVSERTNPELTSEYADNAQEN